MKTVEFYTFYCKQFFNGSEDDENLYSFGINHQTVYLFRFYQKDLSKLEVVATFAASSVDRLIQNDKLIVHAQSKWFVYPTIEAYEELKLLQGIHESLSASPTNTIEVFDSNMTIFVTMGFDGKQYIVNANVPAFANVDKNSEQHTLYETITAQFPHAKTFDSRKQSILFSHMFKRFDLSEMDYIMTPHHSLIRSRNKSILKTHVDK